MMNLPRLLQKVSRVISVHLCGLSGSCVCVCEEALMCGYSGAKPVAGTSKPVSTPASVAQKKAESSSSEDSSSEDEAPAKVCGPILSLHLYLIFVLFMSVVFLSG